MEVAYLRDIMAQKEREEIEETEQKEKEEADSNEQKLEDILQLEYDDDNEEEEA